MRTLRAQQRSWFALSFVVYLAHEALQSTSARKKIYIEIALKYSPAACLVDG